LRPETFERVRSSVVLLNPRIALPPGRYQLRVGVRETGVGEMGSVFYDLNVPDFQARGIAMSGLLLTDQAARTQFTPQVDADLPAGTLPSPATSRRTFSRNDVLSVFAELYDNSNSRDPVRIEVATSLIGEDGVARFSSREDLAGNTSISKQIPLNEMRPGTYVLRMEARALSGGAKPVLRETSLTIVP
jgi:hypothetical protein